METLYGCGNILPNSLEWEMLLIQEVETLKTHILRPVAYTCCKSCYLDLANTISPHVRDFLIFSV
jgi:hypothetical protein